MVLGGSVLGCTHVNVYNQSCRDKRRARRISFIEAFIDVLLNISLKASATADYKHHQANNLKTKRKLINDKKEKKKKNF